MVAALLEQPMARKRVDPEPRRLGRPPLPEGQRPQALTIRAKPPWKEWLVAFANREHVDMADLIHEGLALLAKTKGFDPPPER
jgi:hypothetical protein